MSRRQFSPAEYARMFAELREHPPRRYESLDSLRRRLFPGCTISLPDNGVVRNVLACAGYYPARRRIINKGGDRLLKQLRQHPRKSIRFFIRDGWLHECDWQKKECKNARRTA